MAHHQTIVADEQYEFKSATRNKIFYLLGFGVLLFLIGLFLAMGEKKHEGGHEGGHASAETHQLVASADQEPHATDASAEQAKEHQGGGEQQAEHHEEGTAPWLLKLKTSLWMNNIFFIGLGIIGLFFVAIQYAAQAGWSAGVIRVPLAMGRWIPIAGGITLGLFLWFLVTHDIFHWTHAGLYEKGTAHYDPIIAKKAPFFFFPLEGGSIPVFFLFRMILFFGMWYMFFIMIRKNMLAEDIDNNTTYWYKNRVISTWFLIFFAVSSSVCAWDWVMSIDTHWFSTMFGWYVFASWWVTGLAMITLIVAYLKDAGYLKVVNSNHLHDLGKFCFAFSIFWTYIWFGQFLLIYYANIPEESVYFIERMKTSPYSWIFYANLVLNFVLPFLLFMTRDAKRQISTLKLVTPIIIVGHWLDFYNMVTPGVMKNDGGLGLLEIGLGLIFMAVYLLVVVSGLTKVPLIGKNHPMLQESLHHHI
jgi:hypothetical protein